MHSKRDINMRYSVAFQTRQYLFGTVYACSIILEFHSDIDTTYKYYNYEHNLLP